MSKYQVDKLYWSLCYGPDFKFVLTYRVFKFNDTLTTKTKALTATTAVAADKWVLVTYAMSQVVGKDAQNNDQRQHSVIMTIGTDNYRETPFEGEVYFRDQSTVIELGKDRTGDYMKGFVYELSWTKSAVSVPSNSCSSLAGTDGMCL
ncbi:MAG: hypothetical protein V2I33_19025, partial [Kangiellaceae bacterium]|nr:hypothetical protein [Kangiellaceae bacterium]